MRFSGFDCRSLLCIVKLVLWMCIHSTESSAVEMGERREYDNPFEDYVSNRANTVDQHGKLHSEFFNSIKSASSSLLEKLNSSTRDMDREDYTIYTGSSGIALLYYLIAVKEKNPEYIKEATKIVKTGITKLKNRHVSFLNGDAGPLALGAVLYHRQGMQEESISLINKLQKLLPLVLKKKSNIPDEVLYGRAGYLYALLFLNNHIEGAIEASIIKEVISVILESGQSLAKQEKRSVPLMYMWHDKYYLGAAHGISGILYMLLQCCEYLTQSQLNNLVKPSIDYLEGVAFSSGNFPSSLGNGSDRLVQWCHGAPGMVDLFALAYKVFGSAHYLETALRCGEVVWRKGILQKSYGICHGVSGNAYTFLTLYQITQDPKHLHRACKFAEWCTTYGKNQNRSPDRPLSLFEGVSGAIYFLIDITEPKKAKFPAYTI